MSDQFWLTPTQLNRIKPHFPLSHGIPRVDDLRVVSGIMHVIRNGLRWRDAPKDYGPQFVAVIAFVGDQHRCRWQRIKHQLGAFVIVHLAFGEQKDQGTAVFVDDGMEFGVQAAFRASDTVGNIPFLSRLAAVRCALRCVASIINCSGAPRSLAREAKMRSKTPKRLHRTKRLYSVLCGP